MYYLKYRPQTINELDNTKIRETLGKALLENNWSHTYLLTGPRGTGKTTTARLIAKIVNCVKRKAGQEPCNKCSSCTSITNGTALDVVEIDAASNRGIDEIRDLRERVKLASSELKYKVYIIDEVHMLTQEAFNALLKTLEEPPAHVIFVLATTEVQKVPQTIVSRCQHFEFKTSTVEETLRSLERVINGEKIKTDKVVLTQIAEASSGSFRDATKLLEQLVSLGEDINIELWQKVSPSVTTRESGRILELLIAGKKKEVLSLIDEYVKSGKKVRDLIASLISNLRDILLLRNGLSIDREDLPDLDDEQASGLINKLTEAISVLRDSPLAQLPLELVVMEFEAKKTSKGVETQVTRTEKQEKDKTINSSDVLEISQKWQEILAGTKPYNHSLSAFLRAAKPSALEEDKLTIEVFYKFHKDKLDETKNRDTIEKVISDIMGTPLKVKFTLGNKI